MNGRKQKNNYFTMLESLVTYSKKSLDYLQTVLTDFNPEEESLRGQMLELHAIEHAADMEKHEMTAKLIKEFITPIEREDIVELAKVIDDITDAIEDILQQIYMLGVETIRPEAMEFITLIGRCVDKLAHIFEEFHNFKHSKTIHPAIVALNRLEEDGDALYIRTMRRLYQEKPDPYTTLAWTRIFQQMERCCDSCEDAANVVEEVMMKNN